MYIFLFSPEVNLSEVPEVIKNIQIKKICLNIALKVCLVQNMTILPKH